MPDDLYSEILLDHHRYPRNFGELPEPTVHVEGKNPLCGDELALDLNFYGDALKDIRFHGHGCAISMASSSMMTEMLKGKSAQEIREWIERFKNFMRDGGALPEDTDMGDLEALAGISKLPVRVKCALLAWTTMEEGLKQLAKK